MVSACVLIFELIQAVLGVVHPGHELHDVLAVTRTYLAVFGAGLGSTLLPTVPGPIARAACWFSSGCRSSGAGTGINALRHPWI